MKGAKELKHFAEKHVSHDQYRILILYTIINNKGYFLVDRIVSLGKVKSSCVREVAAQTGSSARIWYRTRYNAPSDDRLLSLNTGY